MLAFVIRTYFIKVNYRDILTLKKFNELNKLKYITVYTFGVYIT